MSPRRREQDRQEIATRMEQIRQEMEILHQTQGLHLRVRTSPEAKEHVERLSQDLKSLSNIPTS